MTMKKNFLPVLMAGMVVVGSTGFVNADSSSQTVTGNVGETQSAQVKVSGSVATNQGIAPAGKLNVELPTKMTFAVDKDGAFTGGTYTIRNNSKDAIEISVSDFKQTSGDIEVVNAIDTNSERGQVKLTLDGDVDDVNLLPNNTVETKLSKVAGNGGIGTINLIGEAGKKSDADVDANGATGEFNMIFKIKKVDDTH